MTFQHFFTFHVAQKYIGGGTSSDSITGKFLLIILLNLLLIYNVLIFLIFI